MEYNWWLERIPNSSLFVFRGWAPPYFLSRWWSYHGCVPECFPVSTLFRESELINFSVPFWGYPRLPSSFLPIRGLVLPLRYLQAVLGFFQNARFITVGRSSPVSARVSAPPDLKECMVDAVRSPALRACTLSAFVISGADISVFPPMGAPVFDRREILGQRYPCVMFQRSAVPTAMYCSTALVGHVVIRLVSYSTVIRGSAPSRIIFPHWKLKRKRNSFGSRNMRCMSVRLNPSPLSKVLNATVNRATSLAKPTLS